MKNWLLALSALCGVVCVAAAPPAKPTGCKPLYGLVYDPFALSSDNICLSPEQVVIDVQIMATVAKSIRLYNIGVCPEATIALLTEAEKQKMTVVLGVLIGPAAERNENELKMLRRVMRNFSGVVQAVVVGSDAMVNGKIGSANRLTRFMSNAELLIEFIGRAKKIMRQEGWKHPVTTAEGWGVWESEHGAALAEAVDFICLKMTPYYEGRAVECSPKAKSNCIDAAAYTNARATGLSKYYEKDVWVCETSWPSAGKRCCHGIPDKKNDLKAIPSPQGASKYLKQFVEGAGDRPYYISSAFDRDWRRVWGPCSSCAEKNLALSSFENGVCDLCEEEYQLGLFSERRERKTSYKLPSTKCDVPSLPEIRIAPDAPVETTKDGKKKKPTSEGKKKQRT